MIKRHVNSTNMDLTDAISDYLDKKISGLDKFVHSIDDAIARIEVGRTTNHHHKGEVFRAEINLEYSDHKFRAVAEADDLYKAIDMAKEEMANEITKSTRKTRHLLKRGKQKIKELIKSR
jgi:putative sigma-54 modulation protein